MEGNSGITCIEYIAYNNPQEMDAMLVNKGFEPSSSLDELVGKTTQLVSEDDSHIGDLLSIHPDREDIIAHYLQSNPQKQNLGIQATSGCDGKCGCGGKCGGGSQAPVAQQKSNADGTTPVITQGLVVTSVVGIVLIIAAYKLLK